METLTVEDATREKLMTMIANASSEQCKYRITSTEGTVVLLSEETYENLLVTLEMLSTPILFESMQEMHSTN